MRVLRPPTPSRKHCLHLGMHGKIELKLGSTEWTSAESGAFHNHFLYLWHFSLCLQFGCYFLSSARISYLISPRLTLCVHTVQINHKIIFCDIASMYFW